MSYDFNSGIRTGVRSTGVTFDAALRAHMVRVYNHMTAGLLVTGIVAYFVSTSPAMIQAIFGSPLRILVAMTLLYTQLGPASLVALGTLILFMPLQARGPRAPQRL